MQDGGLGVDGSLSAGDAHSIIMSGVPEGLDALVLAQLLGDGAAPGTPAPVRTLLHIARDDRRMVALHEALKFFAPDAKVIMLPAWDCVPYDRVSPNPEVVAKRVSALTTLAAGKRKGGTIVLTTVSSATQRVPTREFIKSALRKIAPGQRMDMRRLARRLEMLGYTRSGTVMEAGEYAQRGGILDLFPPGRSRPVRLDFFGDTLESIRTFDPETQRTATTLNQLVLLPVAELAFSDTVRKRFRTGFVETFGGVTGDDPLYEAVSAGQRYPGMEHWLPLYHEGLETVFDFVAADAVSLDHQVDDVAADRLEQIGEHYDARLESQANATMGAAPYRPLPPKLLYLDEAEWRRTLGAHTVRRFTPFETPEGSGGATVVPVGGRVGRRFAAERSDETANVFEAVAGYVKSVTGAGRRVLIAAWSAGARERLMKLMGEHGLRQTQAIDAWPEFEALSSKTVGFTKLGVEQGFETPAFCIVGEQDILGDRFVRPKANRRKASQVLTEATSLGVGDFVVHADHGIGRFQGLATIEAGGAPHDCLELHYHGGDKLFLPVENIELLSRYGSDGAEAQLDRLGGAGWQTRKARLKQRIREIANQLIKVAAQRMLKTAPVLEVNTGLSEEFATRFPFEPTEDQMASIEAVMGDLASGRPMDRLVCGDVGFGKTEVAIRAAFVAAMNGKQVALVVPTTLLARQHFKTFRDRFQGLPVKVRQASRLVTPKELTETKAALKSGEVDIVVGTHALLGTSVEFADLGLLIIDEEQHFGVQHKERLKEMRGDVHVLTLTATPIPRTLQLSLTGVRELSLITTPPVDRLAVRTYVSPVDPVVLRDALLRERNRGGQSFYVCPRVSDLEEVGAFLRETVPELKFQTAHGQMAPGTLDSVMNAFYDGEFDVLLSTTIVESGLDVSTANTLIVHRADMFGLAQLYQIRGRVGRSKRRAYAYLTLPPNKQLTEGAEKRLKVLQSLDNLGAGFTLASHDLDIRGAGNLLGEEQSGHIREVGFELYQSMLEEAVASLKEGDDAGEVADQWSPQISLGTAVLIPEAYVPDLSLRLGLYRRLSSLQDREQIEQFGAELIDRFGPLPEEVAHLLEIVEIKGFCRRANVSNIDAGPRGAVITFRDNAFANPAGLLAFAAKHDRAVRIQPDHKMLYQVDWETDDRRLAGARALTRKLAEIAESKT